MVIGVTGGVGAGKSFVLSIIEEEFDAKLLHADEIAHQLTEPEHSCYERIVEEFGTGILKEDQTIDRNQLAEIVFGDPSALKKLNHIVHPMVKEYIQGEISCILLEDPAKIIVIEAALLIEDHYEEICDEIWYVKADEEIRRKRLKENRNYTDERIDKIIKSQLKESEFEKNCQRIINNNGNIEKTRQEIKNALEF
ncbi:MAG: dephospho-CoA kinase [Lachnospiraceae bacterium]|jgi:dephospho-CoA kinase|nr:dephospho-CoA kinase [Lachnospiraceae bacterium]